jgi:copper chaperone CopZ
MEGKYMAYYVHHVPGRLRIKTAGLKKNSSRARELKLCLEEMHGVLETDVSIITGSIVIKYDAEVVSSTAIMNNLHGQGYIRDVAHTSNQVSYEVHPMQKVTDTFVQKLVEAALERSATALVAALI